MRAPTDSTLDTGAGAAVVDGERPLAAFRTPLALALLVGGVMLLGLLTWVLLSGDGGPAELEVAATEAEDDATPSPELVQDELVDPEDLPVVTYEIHLARDPFDPVVPEEPDAPDPDDPDAPDPDDPDAPDPDDPDAPDPDDPDPDDPADPDDPDRCVGDEEVVCNGEVVSLHELTVEDGQRVAVIQVDTTVYEVREGESFADRYRLLSIGDDEIVALFGDTRFTLPLGERVMK